MNILKNRSANNKKNIYQKSNIFGSSNISFNFQKGMKSIDREDLYFNNYFKNRNNYFRFVKKEYYNFINGKININDYTIKGLGNNVKKRIEKLYKETYGFIKLPLPYLHRISYNNNKAFQLLYVDKTNEIILGYDDVRYYRLAKSLGYRFTKEEDNYIVTINMIIPLDNGKTRIKSYSSKNSNLSKAIIDPTKRPTITIRPRRPFARSDHVNLDKI